jgi:hypothetical protein
MFQPHLIPRGLEATGGTVGVAALVFISCCLLWCWLARRRGSAAVRSALSHTDPETRRAGVLVAAGHSLRRYGRILLRHTRHETAEEVLITRAEVARQRRCRGRGSRGKLRRWADAFLSDRDVPQSGHRDDALPDRACGEPDAGVAVIDPLQAFEAVPREEPPALLACASAPSLLPAPVWTAAPGQLDPLAVLASLGDDSFTRRTRRTPPRLDRRGPAPARPQDPEALIDRLVGITPRCRARSDDLWASGSLSFSLQPASTSAVPNFERTDIY